MAVLAVWLNQKGIALEYFAEKPGSEVRAESSESEMKPM